MVPPRDHADALQRFDCAVRACYENFSCSVLDDRQWELATLSTKKGGLGLRSIRNHSTAAFLSSQTACHKLCLDLDPEYQDSSDQHSSAQAQSLRDYNDQVLTADQISAAALADHRQQSLSNRIDESIETRLFDPAAVDLASRAHHKLVTTGGAGQWLHTVPLKACKHDVEPQLYCTMLKQWLRTPIYGEEF